MTSLMAPAGHPVERPLERLFARHPELVPVAGQIEASLRLLSRAYRDGHRVLVCGNGGSAADADHIVGELMKSMGRRRPVSSQWRAALVAAVPDEMLGAARYLGDHLEQPLPTLNLSAQTALLSAVANDSGADLAFAQQVYGYGRPGDVLWALSTSGGSRNVVLAAITARARRMPVVALTGERGEPLGSLADAWVRVPTADASEAQELHVAVYHALCAALEEELLERSGTPSDLDAGGRNAALRAEAGPRPLAELVPRPAPPGVPVPTALGGPRPVRLSKHLYLVGGQSVSHRYDASVYLLTGPEPALIDCGTRQGWPAIRANLGSLGVTPDQLHTVLATHCHYDHISGYADLCRESGATLLLHEADAEAAASGDPDRTAAFLYDTGPAPALEITDGLPDRYESGPVQIRSIHTPGHTPGSTCFLVQDGPMRILIAGDTLFGGYHARIGSDLDAWADSLGRLADLDFDYLSVGHSHPPLLADGRRIVGEARLQLGVYFDPWFRPFYLRFNY